MDRSSFDLFLVGAADGGGSRGVCSENECHQLCAKPVFGIFFFPTSPHCAAAFKTALASLFSLLTTTKTSSEPREPD